MCFDTSELSGSSLIHLYNIPKYMHKTKGPGMVVFGCVHIVNQQGIF